MHFVFVLSFSTVVRVFTSSWLVSKATMKFWMFAVNYFRRENIYFLWRFNEFFKKILANIENLYMSRCICMSLCILLSRGP